jgi:hypothetical protein
MQKVDRSRIKKLAVKRVIKDEVPPCRHCKNKNFNWDFILMIKTCKTCNDESGVM